MGNWMLTPKITFMLLETDFSKYLSAVLTQPDVAAVSLCSLFFQ